MHRYMYTYIVQIAETMPQELYIERLGTLVEGQNTHGLNASGENTIKYRYM